MRRTVFAAAVLVALAVLLVPQGASAGKPSRTCPPAFDLGALTVEQALQLPRSQAGLAAGEYDVASFTALFDSVDHNHDDLICWQTVPPSGTEPSFWPFNYNVVDNNASVPSR